MAIIPRRFDSNPWFLRIRRMGGAAYHAWIANDPKAISEFKDLMNSSKDFEVLLLMIAVPFFGPVRIVRMLPSGI